MPKGGFPTAWLLLGPRGYHPGHARVGDQLPHVLVDVNDDAEIHTIQRSIPAVNLHLAQQFDPKVEEVCERSLLGLRGRANLNYASSSPFVPIPAEAPLLSVT